jgi:hypothetical protein
MLLELRAEALVRTSSWRASGCRRTPDDVHDAGVGDAEDLTQTMPAQPTYLPTVSSSANSSTLQPASS